jgi:hypothetical protein
MPPPQPWIDPAVRQVGGQVDGDVAHGDDQHAALDQRVVAGLDAEQCEASEAGPGEDGLGDDGAGEQRPGLQAEDGDHRQRGVAQRVHQQHAALRGPLGARRADVVVRQVFEHAGAQHARQHRGHAEAEGQRRQHQVCEAVASGDGCPLQVDGEHQDEQRPQPEIRHRRAQHGDAAPEGVPHRARPRRRQDAQR